MNEVTLNKLMDFLEELPTKSGPIRLPERGAIAKLVIGACEKLEPDKAIDVTVDRLMEESVTLAPQALRARVQTTLIALGLLPHPQPQNAPSQQQKQPQQQQPQQQQQHPSEGAPNGGLSAEAREELFVTNLLDGLIQGRPPPGAAARVISACAPRRPLQDFIDELAEIFPNAPQPFFANLVPALGERGLIAYRLEGVPIVPTKFREATPVPAKSSPSDARPVAKAAPSDATTSRAQAAPAPRGEVRRTPAPVEWGSPLACKGTRVGADVLLTLPEMTVTFSRGLVIQAWVRPESLRDDAPIVVLGDPAGRSQIELIAEKGGAIKLSWDDTAGKSAFARTSPVLTSGQWSHVTAAIGPDGVKIIVDDVDRSPSISGGLPAPASRALNFIGARAGEDTRFTGAIADVRLWNRADALDGLLARSKCKLRGDEVGLCGWWTLEGKEGIQDGSPFGRHGRRSGAAFTAGPSTFELKQLSGDPVLDFGGKGKVVLAEMELDEGFTWEANICVSDSEPMTLLSLTSEFGQTLYSVSLKSERGALVLDVERTDQSTRRLEKIDALVALRDASNDPTKPGKVHIVAQAAIREKRWAHVAVTCSCDGAIRLLVNSSIVGTGSLQPGWSPGPAFSGELGSDFDGQMAEVRVWSRVLPPGELLELSKRRIHGWAPGLLGCWRMDEPTAQRTLTNAALRGATATVSGKDVIPADNGSLSLTRATTQVMPRAARLPKNETLTLPAMTNIGSGGFSVQLWVRPDTLTDSTLLTLPAESNDGSALALELVDKGDLRVTKVHKEQESSKDSSPAKGSSAKGSPAKGSPAKGSRAAKDSLADGVAKAVGNTIETVTDLYDEAKETVERIQASIDRSVTATDVLRARHWSHFTVTFDPDGVVCVYYNGQLVVRETSIQFRVKSFTSGTLGGDEFFGSVTELRVWSRALSAREIRANWKRRVSRGAGLCGRWALSENLSGTPGPVKGTARMCEAAKLAIQDERAAVLATVDVACSLLGDQMEKGAKPQIALDLLALDNTGKPLGGVDITITLDEELALYRSRVDKSRLLPKKGGQYVVKTSKQGRVRVVFEVSQLVAPLLRLRHASMTPGEWVIMAPDVVIHEALVALTGGELRDGPKATAATRAGKEGLVSEGYDELAKVLRGMARTIGTCSYAVAAEGALAFGGDDEAPAASTPLEPVEGNIFRVPEEGTLVRRLARPAARDAPAVPESFGLFDWIEDTFEAAVEWTEDLVEEGIETIENVVDGVVNGIKLGVDTVIDGIKVAAEWVIETVDDVVQALCDVFAKIKKAISDVLSLLAALYDWGDILETAEFTLKTLKGALKSAKDGTQSLFDLAETEIRSAETTILELLKGTPTFTTEATTAKSQSWFDSIEVTTPLDYLLGLIPDDIGPSLDPLLALFDPLKDVATNALSKITTLGTGLDQELQSGELKEALAHPEKFVDTDPGEWFNLARIFTRLAANSVVLALDLLSDVLIATLDVIGNILDFRINIPVLTDFVEEYVLDGKSLTAGRLFCLLTAIPTTLVYKLVKGCSGGPAALESGPASFAYDDEAAGAASTADAVVGSVSAIVAFITDILDVAEVAADKAKGFLIFNCAAGGIALLADAHFVFAHPFIDGNDPTKKSEWSEAGGAGKAGIVFNIASWLLGATAVCIDAVALYKKNDGLGTAATVAGVFSSGAGFVAGVLDCVETFSDKKHTEGAGAVAVLDTVSSLADTVAGIAVAIPAKDGVGKIARGATVVTAHVVGFSASLSSIIVSNTTEQ